jgi:hypothetical protein
VATHRKIRANASWMTFSARDVSWTIRRATAYKRSFSKQHLVPAASAEIHVSKSVGPIVDRCCDAETLAEEKSCPLREANKAGHRGSRGKPVYRAKRQPAS